MKQNILIKIHIILNVKMSSKQKTLLLGMEETKIRDKRTLMFLFVIEGSSGLAVAGGPKIKKREKQKHWSLQLLKGKKSRLDIFSKCLSRNNVSKPFENCNCLDMYSFGGWGDGAS